MWRFLLPERRSKAQSVRDDFWQRLRALAVALVIVVVPGVEASMSKAQRAIEELEGCSTKERGSGCVKILKKKSLGGDKLAIKAQVRGGRIIWYEYNGAKGTVRRTN